MVRRLPNVPEGQEKDGQDGRSSRSRSRRVKLQRAHEEKYHKTKNMAAATKRAEAEADVDNFLKQFEEEPQSIQDQKQKALQNQKRPEKDLLPGCKVRLSGLKGAAELNGESGTLESFFQETGRWRVKLNTGQSKDLKPENLDILLTQANHSQQGAPQAATSQKRPVDDLRQGCKVQLQGLKGAAELNGQKGVLDCFIQGTGRWRVKLSSGQNKDIKPENIITV